MNNTVAIQLFFPRLDALLLFVSKCISQLFNNNF